MYRYHGNLLKLLSCELARQNHVHWLKFGRKLGDIEQFWQISTNIKCCQFVGEQIVKFAKSLGLDSKVDSIFNFERSKLSPKVQKLESQIKNFGKTTVPRAAILFAVTNFRVGVFSSVFGFSFGGFSIQRNFSTSAAICALGERGDNRNRVTG